MTDDFAGLICCKQKLFSPTLPHPSLTLSFFVIPDHGEAHVNLNFGTRETRETSEENGQKLKQDIDCFAANIEERGGETQNRTRNSYFARNKVPCFNLLGLIRSDFVDIGFNGNWSEPITPERIY